MRKNMKQWVLILVCMLLLVGCSQSAKDSPAGESSGSGLISVVNWNVQTFFDSQTEGTEYPDFQSSAKWSKDKYVARLQRLCDVITTLNADIYVFEEIENEGILYDISNQLAGNSWNSKKMWNYGSFVKAEDSAIGCAVISRFPLDELKTHNLDIKLQKEKQPSMRPIMQIKTTAYNKDLLIFVNHWKSKSSGEDESKIWRDWQESVLCNAIVNAQKNYGEDLSCLICGDFNRDILEFISDFSGSQKENIILRGNNQNIKVYSPWLTGKGNLTTEIGTYYFNKNWERIDNFFICGKTKLSSFAVKAEEPWAKENNIPIPYKIYTGEGYSDHLPIMVTLRL